MPSETLIIEAETGAIAAVTKTPPDELRNKRRTEALFELADSITIASKEEYELAAAELRNVVELHTSLEAERVSFTGPLNAVLNKLNERFQPYLKALRGDGKKGCISAESIIKGKMGDWITAENARIAEERRAAEELARQERERLQREADALRAKAEAEERERQAAEQRRIAEAAAAQKLLDDAAAAIKGKKAREQAAAAAEAQRLENERIALENAQAAEAARLRAEEAAQAMEQTAAVVLAQTPQQTVFKGRGISTPKTVDFEVLSLFELATHIVMKRPDLIVLLQPDEAKLRMQVKMMGMKTDLPGVRVFERTGITVR